MAAPVFLFWGGGGCWGRWRMYVNTWLFYSILELQLTWYIIGFQISDIVLVESCDTSITWNVISIVCYFGLIYMCFILCTRKRVGGLKLEELPGLEALQTPGMMLNMYWMKPFIWFCANCVLQKHCNVWYIMHSVAGYTYYYINKDKLSWLMSLCL